MTTETPDSISGGGGSANPAAPGPVAEAVEGLGHADATESSAIALMGGPGSSGLRQRSKKGGDTQRKHYDYNLKDESLNPVVMAEKVLASGKSPKASLYMSLAFSNTKTDPHRFYFPFFQQP